MPIVRSTEPLKMSSSVTLTSTRVMVAPPVSDAMRSPSSSRVRLSEMRLPLMESAESRGAMVEMMSPPTLACELPVAMGSPPSLPYALTLMV